MTVMVSPHFSWKEMTRTDARLSNTPGPRERASLVRLADNILEPAREIHIPGVGRAVGALNVHSGFRCRAVNTAVGGSKDSAHMRGDAADLDPMDPAVSCFALFEAFIVSTIPFDKAIFECPADGVWLHLQNAKVGARPRRQALMCLQRDVFVPWNPSMIGEDRRRA